MGKRLAHHPLIDAVLNNDAERVRQVLAAADVKVDERDETGRTPLMHCAIDGDEEIATILLQHGANPEATDFNGSTALHFAAQNSRLEVIRVLLQRGAKVDPADKDGNTPLWKATFHCAGRGETIEALLGAGADAAQPNHNGVSPLDLAKTIANHNLMPFFRTVPGKR